MDMKKNKSEEQKLMKQLSLGEPIVARDYLGIQAGGKFKDMLNNGIVL